MMKKDLNIKDLMKEDQKVFWMDLDVLIKKEDSKVIEILSKEMMMKNNNITEKNNTEKENVFLWLELFSEFLQL